MKIFITGGSGYVGRNLIRGLRKKKHSIIALARSEASAAKLRQLGAKPALGDVLDHAALAKAMKGCQVVIHAAADTNHGEGTPEQERINVEGTRTVFAAAREAKVKLGIHISTEAVLADGNPLIRVNESHPIPDRHAGNYSRTKALAEIAALGESKGNLAVCAIRPRFVWGRDDTTALPQLIDAANTGKLKWIDGGHYLTSTTHIANLVAGVEAALAKAKGGEIYFVTDGAPVSFRNFVTELLSTQGVTAPSGSVPRWLVRLALHVTTFISRVTRGRIKPPMSWQEYGTVAHEMTIDDSKARRELGYRPTISVEKGLAELRVK
ncbi:NAD-dependent epimerase/dehydratase family protein [Turneriella parva]|uniref:3-beta hydroxysteroid dehydrogenase/isomerase n=1 Tax=Turneriella parva (strain ATCC BAA-1111 / DSM 21527 / NCTC 11395 / H) TaxID=869212 RepID=I4B153_TURPD|nr:NAD-dependent epimerase/dehydratase family protein [Turneriella parva]AFM11010.1 3-beta hydroxysteroid dehydrogenase/isomerase [Turneriella parva DSM 21527]